MKYKITLMGYECILMPGTGEGTGCSHALLLSYDGRYDFCVCDAGKKQTGSALAAAVLSAFFGGVRGYPEMQLDAFFDGRRLPVDILSSRAGRVRLKPVECNVLCTKTARLPDCSELAATTVGTVGVRVRVAECRDVGFFSRDRLSTLRILKGMPDCDAAYAVSTDGECAECIGSAGAPFDALLTLFGYLRGRGVQRIALSGFVAELDEDGSLSLPAVIDGLS